MSDEPITCDTNERDKAIGAMIFGATALIALSYLLNCTDMGRKISDAGFNPTGPTRVSTPSFTPKP